MVEVTLDNAKKGQMLGIGISALAAILALAATIKMATDTNSYYVPDSESCIGYSDGICEGYLSNGDGGIYSYHSSSAGDIALPALSFVTLLALAISHILLLIKVKKGSPSLLKDRRVAFVLGGLAFLLIVFQIAGAAVLSQDGSLKEAISPVYLVFGIMCALFNVMFALAIFQGFIVLEEQGQGQVAGYHGGLDGNQNVSPDTEFKGGMLPVYGVPVQTYSSPMPMQMPMQMQMEQQQPPMPGMQMAPMQPMMPMTMPMQSPMPVYTGPMQQQQPQQEPLQPFTAPSVVSSPPMSPVLAPTPAHSSATPNPLFAQHTGTRQSLNPLLPQSTGSSVQTSTTAPPKRSNNPILNVPGGWSASG